MWRLKGVTFVDGAAIPQLRRGNESEPKGGTRPVFAGSFVGDRKKNRMKNYFF